MKHYGARLADVAARLQPLLEAKESQRALEILARDFTDVDGVGARRVALFLTGGPDDALQADVVGLVTELLAKVGPRGNQ